MRKALLVVVLTATLSAQDHLRRENAALLGIVSIEKDKKVFIAHVLKRSPAQRAKVKAGDELVKIGTRAIKRHSDVDAALKEYTPGASVGVVVKREGARVVLRAKLIARRKYKADFLKPMARGRKGFKAPPWFAFAWANIAEGREAPTLENTKGKVVVFHTFQSW